MSGLLTRIWIEVRWPILWFCLGLASIMALLTRLLPKVLGNIHEMFSKMPMVKPLLTAMLGVDPGDKVSTELSQAFLWVHPTVLTLLWAHAVMYCTRVPAGEVDRGTADFLLCLPVTRVQIYVAETLGGIFSGLLILLTGFVGHRLGSIQSPHDMILTAGDSLRVLVNLGCVSTAVGSLACLISACSDRRGKAIGVVFAILVASFLLNFLAQFQDWAKSISWLSVMEYYRPAIIIQTHQLPWKDLAVLAGISFVCWTAGLLVFKERSICTV